MTIIIVGSPKGLLTQLSTRFRTGGPSKRKPGLFHRSSITFSTSTSNIIAGGMGRCMVGGGGVGKGGIWRALQVAEGHQPSAGARSKCP